jgi:predicted GNAT family N-acyltransferase
MKLKIAKFKSSQYYQALALRDKVLRAPLGLFFSGEDILAEHHYTHFIILQEDQVVATAQMVNTGNGAYKMRQVAVDFEFQSLGLGTQLVDFIENWARESGVLLITLHARETAVPFYEKRNYSKKGDSFMEVGIPHFLMEKPISS